MLSLLYDGNLSKKCIGTWYDLASENDIILDVCRFKFIF